MANEWRHQIQQHFDGMSSTILPSPHVSFLHKVNSPVRAASLLNQNHGTGQCSQVYQEELPMPSSGGGAEVLQHPQQQTMRDEHFLVASATTKKSTYQPQHDEQRKHHYEPIPSRRFPCLLYDMLQSVESRGFAGIVSWIPPTKQGDQTRVFRVHDIPKFGELVLPLYFNTCRYKSFQRNLNMHKYHHASHKGTYTHPLLIRGHKELSESIKRPSMNQKRFQQDAPTDRSCSLKRPPSSNDDVPLQAAFSGPNNTSSLLSSFLPQTVAPVKPLDLGAVSGMQFRQTQQETSIDNGGFQQYQPRQSPTFLGPLLRPIGETPPNTSWWMGDHEKDLLSLSYQVVEYWSREGSSPAEATLEPSWTSSTSLSSQLQRSEDVVSGDAIVREIVATFSSS